MIAVLYLTRWRIEKLFDTIQSRLEETKGWAVGAVAQDTRAHPTALTHKLLVLLREELQRDRGIREEKVERKRKTQLLHRQARARARAMGGRWPRSRSSCWGRSS